jgi:hypothetical protein
MKIAGLAGYAGAKANRSEFLGCGFRSYIYSASDDIQL